MIAMLADGDEDENLRSNVEREEFENAVEKCKEYIRAGDIFQVVPSQRLAVQTTAKPFDIYRALRVVNPSPFMFLMNMVMSVTALPALAVVLDLLIPRRQAVRVTRAVH